LFLTCYLVKSERSSNYVGGERSHGLSRVRSDNSGKSRNGSWDGLCAKESENSELSKTSVVQFSAKTTLLGLLRHVLGELEGIVKVEWNRVGNSGGSSNEVREVTWLSSSHVMLVVRGGKLGPELKESDKSENLPLSIVRYSIPKSRGVGLRRESSSVHLHCPWELDSVSMYDVSYESKHSNTSVLDLSMTEESDGSLVGGTPELSLSKIKRIVESYDWVKFLSKSLKVSLLKAFEVGN
jgi:hypothetical protein